MNTAILLRREYPSISVPKLSDDVKVTLKNLGYHAFEDSTRAEIARYELERLGIQPFSDSSVRLYKIVRVLLQFVPYLAIAALTVAALALACKLGVVQKDPHVLGVTTLVGIVLIGVVSMVIYGIRHPWCHWESTRISVFNKPMPIRVLNRIAEIKQANANVDFSIDELRTWERDRIVFDPFLILHMRGQDYYIDVWNEPGW